eukprot:TRINITY_DN11555_c4_g3_i3.p1 TRINITY_DN11555_c4_g3~~TRINITY_DN11555_c4_g3_i3.p1  ORF type:complete len:412 (+),score=62.75 TRINITY_DN11555_c4_g3_i3:83-1318(+)
MAIVASASSPSNALKAWLAEERTLKDNLDLSTTQSNGFSAVIDGPVECLAALPSPHDLHQRPSRRKSHTRQPSLTDAPLPLAPTTCNHASQRSSNEPSLNDLPREVLIRIGKHLSARQLCRLSQTCRHLRDCLKEDHLWRHCLRAEMPIWPFVSHATLPSHHGMYRNVKHTYLKCSPLSGSPSRLIDALAGRGLIRRFLRGAYRPRIAIFGPGLETPGYRILNTIMWSMDSPFSMQGLAPGRQGIGGGVRLLHEETRTSVDLITLYQHTAQERGDPNSNAPSRLLPNGRLSQATRAICQELNAVVFVVDAEQISARSDGCTLFALDDALGNVTEEMHQVMDATNNANVPLLVLAASSSSTSIQEKASVVDVATALRLGATARPWRVEAVSVENMAGGLHRAHRWLLSSMTA